MKKYRINARSIYEDIKAQIFDGTYIAGAPMPSTRALALQLGVARTTVVTAYEQLLCEGLIETHPGAPTRVAPIHPPVEKTGAHLKVPSPRLSEYGLRVERIPPRYSRRPDLLVDFRYGDLAGVDFPTQVWRRAVNLAASQDLEKIAYADPRGSLPLRKALQAHLGVASRNGNNCTLRILSCLPQRPEPAVLDLFALAPNIITGQVDVLPAQR